MVNLETIQQDDFEKFLEHEIRGYAEGHVRNGNWPAEGALERSRQDFEHLLQDGIQSENQHLWSIQDGDRKVGVLWVQVKGEKAFIYDFVIDEQYRGKGYGKQALTTMDDRLRAMGVASVALHVFGDNTVAQELYKKMGFEITGMHMHKKLRE